VTGRPTATASRREQVLDELRRTRRVDEDPAAAVLRVAILLEDALDLVLDDADLADPALLEDPEAVVDRRSVT